MITVHFANAMVSIAENSLLTELLEAQGYANKQFAIAINRQFIPRSCYATTQLQAGDIIDIITPMQGG